MARDANLDLGLLRAVEALDLVLEIRQIAEPFYVQLVVSRQLAFIPLILVHKGGPDVGQVRSPGSLAFQDLPRNPGERNQIASKIQKEVRP